MKIVDIQIDARMIYVRVMFGLLGSACSSGSFAADEAEGDDAGTGNDTCDKGPARCAGSRYLICREGAYEVAKECGARSCDTDLGCVDCTGDQTTCQGDLVLGCDKQGSFSKFMERCDAAQGMICSFGRCQNACEAAAASHSYQGCLYYPTVTMNSELGPFGGEFDFAVVIANPQTVPVPIEVTRAGVPVASRAVPAGEVETITLPWVPELRQRINEVFPFLGDVTSRSSILLRAGAYRLTSTLPVTAYQFNPLQFSLGGENSHTNDASLLLPAVMLGRSYLGISRPTWRLNVASRGVVSTIPGFLSIVGIADDTTVTVRTSAHLLPGLGVSVLAAGSTATYALGNGDVLQLATAGGDWTCTPVTRHGLPQEACVAGRDYDLTGTSIEANHPVAVFGGHSCTFIPFNRSACDHLEEQLFPLDTWGTSILVVSTEPQVADEPNVFRVISGSNANTLTFEPPVIAPLQLDAGEFAEFLHQGAFRVSGTGRVAIAQFMVGEDYGGDEAPPDVGDPAMGLGIPYAQFRTAYDFLAPETFVLNYVNIIAPLGAGLLLDGGAIPALEAIGETGFGFARVSIAAGVHHIESPIDAQPFGITVSGLASYTSYLYPGGLNLQPIPIE